MTIEKPKISVAFICLGNFCRSPMAEAIFKHEVEKANLENRFNKIDSFGTSNYHVGKALIIVQCPFVSNMASRLIIKGNK
ncbi:CGH_1_collapsed_G0015810.mRNA.1.CDS.1 [Saccharomyces cerevisiae]|nr:CGH_1_collapsed_G0015810.mRNA.1.CDS.1 [Saccharomyces cerevisiae]